MFKVNNKDTRTTPWHRSGVSIINFEQVNTGWVSILTSIGIFLEE